MKNRLKKVENYLKEEPRARERSNRYRAIGNLIRKENPTLVEGISKDKLDEICFNSIQINRCIQRAQQLDKTLRGEDYNEKKVELEQQAQIDLGYSAGYHNDIKQLKKL